MAVDPVQEFINLLLRQRSAPDAFGAGLYDEYGNPRNEAVQDVLEEEFETPDLRELSQHALRPRRGRRGEY